jgi:hypothetical protein
MGTHHPRPPTNKDLIRLANTPHATQLAKQDKHPCRARAPTPQNNPNPNGARTTTTTTSISTNRVYYGELWEGAGKPWAFTFY